MSHTTKNTAAEPVGWQVTVPCRDALGRDRQISVAAHGTHTIVLRVPAGEAASFTRPDADALVEAIAAAARRLEG